MAKQKKTKKQTAKKVEKKPVKATSKKDEKKTKKTAKDVVSSVKKKTGEIVVKVKEYKADLDTAYQMGYRAGWQASEELPKRRGAKTVAKSGFGKGMKEHSLVDKYKAKSQKGVKVNIKKPITN